MTVVRAVLVACAAMGLPGLTRAQSWECFIIDPVGADHAMLTATGGAGVQAGYQTIAKQFASRAAVWTGAPPSGPISLHPSGAASSYILASNGVQHVGQGTWDWNVLRALLWTGTSNQPIDLHVPAYLHTAAFATDGQQQVGAGDVGPGTSHALRWTGTAASAVDLHPLGASHSQARGVGGGRQVGLARFELADRAGYWTGNAASWTSLHPGAAWAESVALGVSADGVEQAGSARHSSGQWRAALWRGSAASFVDLHPDTLSNGWSEASATDGQRQVGYVERPFRHAAVWEGSSASVFDLHFVLPPGFEYSAATGVARDRAGVWISGYAGTSAPVEVGVLWHLPVACYPDCNADGDLTVADFGCFQTQFVAQDPYADCNEDGALTVADFGCFQTQFVSGCP